MILSIISHKNASKLILLAICNIVIVKKYNDRKIVCRYYSKVHFNKHKHFKTFYQKIAFNIWVWIHIILVKMLPWEWKIEYITQHSHPPINACHCFILEKSLSLVSVIKTFPTAYIRTFSEPDYKLFITETRE